MGYNQGHTLEANTSFVRCNCNRKINNMYSPVYVMKNLETKALLFFAWMIGSSTLLRAEEAPDYWPLEVGNQWVYLHHGVDDGQRFDNQVILEVLKTKTIDGNSYAELSNGQLLRKDEAGNIIEYNQFERPRDVSELIIFDLTNLDEQHYRSPHDYTVFPPRLGLLSYPFIFRDARREDDEILNIPAGTFREVLTFSHGDSGGYFGVSLARDIGPVLSRYSTDVVDSEGNAINSAIYELMQYRIDGTTRPIIGVVRADSWAEIKMRDNDSFISP